MVFEAKRLIKPANFARISKNYLILSDNFAKTIRNYHFRDLAKSENKIHLWKNKNLYGGIISKENANIFTSYNNG